MITVGHDSLNCRRKFSLADKEYHYYSIKALDEMGLGNFRRLPACMKVILENLLRFDFNDEPAANPVNVFKSWMENSGSCNEEINFRPSRVLMQDFTGVPAVVDLAAMRDAMVALGGNPNKINPLNPVDLVIDHSVMIDFFGTSDSLTRNVKKEYERNSERYSFLKWGQQAFKNFRVVPPGTGICHQVNLEYLSKTIWTDIDQNGHLIAYPDTLVGTDSHTTMVNGLSVLGWGVGGIEAEAAMLGQPVSMLLPEVIGVNLTGEFTEGVTATDLVLKIVEVLRGYGVVGKFVEFFGEGLKNLKLADRATIANMAPEYGATCGFFPVDNETLRYLELSGRDRNLIDLVKHYSKENEIWYSSDYSPMYTDTISINISEIYPAISGPKRPQDFVPLIDASFSFKNALVDTFKQGSKEIAKVKGQEFYLTSGSILIASITSCTNTSNPNVMIAAGLVARKARSFGLKAKPWVKTSLAPGSKVVSDYLIRSGLQDDLDWLGFNLAGYGCTTCIGNSGPLTPEISEAIAENNLVAVSILSGNRNFEGRISPDIKANYLASPPLVVAYSLVGDMTINLVEEPLGYDKNGSKVFLRDLWPTSAEINTLLEAVVTRESFLKEYSVVFKGDENWQAVESAVGDTYTWPSNSTYVQNPPYFEHMGMEKGKIFDIKNARILTILGDMVTTDHISPAGSFKKEHPAGKYLIERQISEKQFNSYGSRRGNHEVMMRGTFANIRIRNEMLDGVEGGLTRDKEGNIVSIFDAAMSFKKDKIPLVVIAGKEYGAGSSRDWAAKGTSLLGVKAVIAESFERIHRSNLIGMGVIPFQFEEGTNRSKLDLKGFETISITGLEDKLKPSMYLNAEISYPDGTISNFRVKCRIDTKVELEYVEHGGVLHYVLRQLANSS
ncbi:MAG: aconitate hydratase AcnA [Paracoccaceae bacterium]